MEAFCESDSFWNTSLTWTDSSWPHFTECFQSTILQWTPIGWLWITSPLYLYHLASKPREAQPLRGLFYGKMVSSLVLIVLELLDMVGAISSSRSGHFNAEILAPIMWSITLILHMVVVVLERSRDVVRSFILFVFWILASCATLVPFYSAFLTEPPLYSEDMMQFFVLCAKYVLMSLCFILNCQAAFYWPKPQNHNPEISASALSWACFFYLRNLLFKGFRKPLVDSDVFSIMDRDKSARVVKQFQRHWLEYFRGQEDTSSVRHRNRRRRSRSARDANEKTPLLSNSGVSKSNAEIHLHGVSPYTSDNDAVFEASDSSIAAMCDGVDVLQAGRTPSFFWTMVRTFIGELVYCGLPFIVYVTMQIFYPFVLGWLMDFVNDPTEQVWHGYIFAGVLVLSRLLSASFNKTAQYTTSRLAVRIKSATIATVFRKALTMSSEARKESTVGEIVNLMSVDADHLEMMINYSFWMWIGIVFIIVGVYLLYTLLGLAMLAGLAFICTMMVGNLLVMHKMREYQDDIMVIKDERVKLMSEILNGIKVLKLYGWEPKFVQKVLEIRERELYILFKYAILDTAETFAWTCSMFWMLYLMLVTFVTTDSRHHLTANTSFISMNYINLVMISVNIVPFLTKDWIKAATSVRRLQRFLTTEDLDPINQTRDLTDRLAVRMNNATFTWEKDGMPILRNINLMVEPGRLIAVVGTVGSGKTSLLSALLGEMNKQSGYFNLNSSVAYVPQQAWIQNATVKENILFGSASNHRFYRQVVHACALQPDFDIMIAGDKTEIGEKGINLSGGQKQRVSLARAVYSQAEIYLLDDPFSAVDSHVGRHIFNEVVGRFGILKSKTRILVTHGVQWLPEVDSIVVMNDGRISEAGTYEELISHNGAFAKFLAQYFTQTEDEEETMNEEGVEQEDPDKEIKTSMLRRLVSMTSDSEAAESHDTPTLKKLLSREISHDDTERDPAFRSLRSRKMSESARYEKSGLESSRTFDLTDFEASYAKRDRGDFEASAMLRDRSRLTTDEEAMGGKVKWTVYMDLFRGLGLRYAFIILLFVIGFHSVDNFGNVWLSFWTDDVDLANFTSHPANSSQREDQNRYYISVYTGLGFLQTFLVLAYSALLQLRHIAASRKLHRDLLESVMHAPMSFFDTTPMGRILNRFSQDVEILDNDIFLELEVVSDHGFKALATIIIISYNMPEFLIVVVPVMMLFYLLQQFYIRTSCQLRRLASNNRSPVYAHFSETLSGVAVIRAYQEQDRFIHNSEQKVDKFQSGIVASNAVNKWIQTSLEILSCVIIGAAVIFAVEFRDQLSAGVVGLTVTYALNIAINLSIATEVLGNLETHAVSVERIREYSVINSEADWRCLDDGRATQGEWPWAGCIQFVNYSIRYREGLDLVLKDLNCTIQGGEKVGLVGRTGAGKSSMVLSIFRLVEAAGGKILIDGVDISKLGLHALRRHLTILPQEPVLFAGSLRMNLDPFGEQDDSAIWTALDHAHLKPFVESLPQKLDHEVGEGGENMSMGQRQLVCLARTLLRKTKILVLDEATAAVDMETDDLIQKTIRSEFSGCTILTIAHRLNTVMDYDRIMVLDSGRLVEFNSPATLLANPASLFYSMAKDAGLVTGPTS